MRTGNSSSNALLPFSTCVNIEGKITKLWIVTHTGINNSLFMKRIFTIVKYKFIIYKLFRSCEFIIRYLDLMNFELGHIYVVVAISLFDQCIYQ